VTGGSAFFQWNRYVADDYRHTMQCEDVNLGDLRYSILREQSPRTWPTDALVEARGAAPEDVPFFVVWPLVSERVRSLIETNCLTGASFYRVRVKSTLPVAVPRYWYVHFQLVYDAVDYDRSIWRQMHLKSLPHDSEQPRMMIKYVLKRSTIGELDRFRCADQRSPIFCSLRFRDLFVQHGCTGLGFDEVSVT